MRLGLRQLRYFVAVAEAGVLSHAAQNLNVAQSALSHHISQLEDSLGVALLERRARGVSLTAPGQRLYEHAQAILASVKATEEDVRGFSELATGTIAVGLSHTVVDHVALSVMRQARERCPGVSLSIAEGLSATLVGRVLSGDLDLALAYNPPDDGRLEVEPLIEEEMFLIGSPDLVGDSADPIRFADIPKQPILAPHPSGSLRAIIDSYVLRSQIEPSGLLQIDSLTAMRTALENGLGFTILARASVMDGLRSGRLCARRIVDPVLPRRLAQVWLRVRPKTRAFSEIGRILTSALDEAVRSGRWPAEPIRS